MTGLGSRRLPRRGVLAAAALAAGARVTASSAAGHAPAAAAGDGAALGRSVDTALHAVRRLTYGPTPELVAHVREIGVSAWVAEELAAGPDVEEELTHLSFPTLHLPAPLLAQAKAHRNPVQELRAATFARATWGRRQVAELLVEFWGNHLSLYADHDAVGALKVIDDREVVRPHALGRFSDLLQASARSPAMLRYLDNASSRGSRPNENYARELLELHTVGIASGFTQRDVRNTALVFTGWTVDSTTGAFEFRPEWHHVGPVQVLGWRSENATPAGGEDVGTSLLAYLSSHPATARHVASKLVRRLVDDAPPAALVASAARTFLDAGTAIVPVVQHVVGSREFAASAGRKTQRPLEWLTASVRALRIEGEPTLGLDGGAGVVGALQRLGHVPFGWPAPDGFPDVTSAWASAAAALARWNLAQALVRGEIAGLQPFDPAQFLGPDLPGTAGALVDVVAGRILGTPPRPGLRDPLLRYVGRPAEAAVSPEEATALTPSLAALVLSSPDMAVR